VAPRAANIGAQRPLSKLRKNWGGNVAPRSWFAGDLFWLSWAIDVDFGKIYIVSVEVPGIAQFPGRQ
jgi:hypothetical protein